MASINYSDKIPNNVNLATDRALQRALEHWQPKFLEWWQGMGPTDFQTSEVYLRTATSVDADGWATYGAAWQGGEILPGTGIARPRSRRQAVPGPVEPDHRFRQKQVVGRVPAFFVKNP
jgi:hypothetical protein